MTGTDEAAARDRGAATIFVVIALPVIIIGTAFAIDVGSYVLQARSAQNSADATALAVATDCALYGAPTADYSPYRKDGQTISTPACTDGEATIEVAKDVDNVLLRQSAGSVDRSATAAWQTLGTALTAPIVISSCEFSEALLEGSTDITLYLDDTKPQTGCSSLPGGFSQLRRTDCAVEFTIGDTADAITAQGKPGADLQKTIPCITNPTGDPLPADILVPLYDSDACQTLDCKGNGQYPIKGFAAFRISGYSFNGNFYDGTLGKRCEDRDRGRYCIRGDFIKFTTLDGTPGPAPDFGLYQISLIR